MNFDELDPPDLRNDFYSEEEDQKIKEALKGTLVYINIYKMDASKISSSNTLALMGIHRYMREYLVEPEDITIDIKPPSKKFPERKFRRRGR